MNTNGVSNCQTNGEERFEHFTSGRGRKDNPLMLIAYDSRKDKARGRSATIMTSSKGVEDKTLTLGRKSLLGR